MTTETATKNGRLPRATLAGQIDRLDTILDGLAEALNESVADAVRKTVGEVVREAVGEAVREVLEDSNLVRAAVARHSAAEAMPDDAQPKRTLAEALGDALGWVVALAAPPVLYSGKALSWAWSWCLQKVRQALSPLAPLCESASAAFNGLAWLCGLAWQSRAACLASLGVGAAVGLIAYVCGPLTSSALAALGSTCLCLAGSAIAGLAQAFGGHG